MGKKLAAGSRQASFVVRNLAQARLLSDPFRLRLLDTFLTDPRTIKEASAALGEPISRLYRHVHALTDAGLLRIVSSRQVRGTIEKRYQAIAGRFEVEPSLFDSKTRGASRRRKADSGTPALLLERAIDEINAVTARPEAASVGTRKRGSSRGPSDEQAPIVVRAQIRSSAKEIAKVRKRLLHLLEQLQSVPEGNGPSESEEWALTLCFAPTKRKADPK